MKLKPYQYLPVMVCNQDGPKIKNFYYSYKGFQLIPASAQFKSTGTSFLNWNFYSIDTFTSKHSPVLPTGNNWASLTGTGIVLNPHLYEFSATVLYQIGLVAVSLGESRVELPVQLGIEEHLTRHRPPPQREGQLLAPEHGVLNNLNIK